MTTKSPPPTAYHRHIREFETLEQAVSRIADGKPEPWGFCAICGQVPDSILGKSMGYRTHLRG